MKKRTKKSRFINLAEQLTLQNEIVGTTMDSLLGYVSIDENVEHRSDFEQIRKTVEQVNELNPAIDIVEHGVTNMPRPKRNRISRLDLPETETSGS